MAFSAYNNTTPPQPLSGATTFERHLSGCNPESLAKGGLGGRDHGWGDKMEKEGSGGEIELDGFGECIDHLSEGSASEKGIVTDRFIPTRRSLSYPPDLPESATTPQN